MKIKENNKNISLSKLPFIFGVSLIASLILRTIQMLSYIDHETGFTTGGSTVEIILYAVIALAFLCFTVISYLSADSGKIDVCVRKNTALGAVSIIFAVSFFYDVFFAFFSSAGSIASVSSDSAFRSMMVTGTLPLFFRSVFAFLSGIYFLIFAKGVLKGNTKVSKHRILALAPVAWAGFRIIHRFVEQISYIRVSDLLLELVMFAFMIIFFMAFAQVASGVYAKGFRWRICGFGFSGALVALSLNGARLIFTLIKGSEALNSNYPYCLCDFIFGLFAFVFLTQVIKETKSLTAEQE